MFYRIVYERNFSSELSSNLSANGWELVLSSKNYYIVSSTSQEYESNPSYSGIIDRNRKLKKAAGIILIILIFQEAFSILLIILIVLLANYVVKKGGQPIKINGTPPVMFYVQMIFYNLLSIGTAFWLLYTFFKIKKTNRQLEILNRGGISSIQAIPIEMAKGSHTGKRIHVLRLRLQYTAPDKVEKWLEKMEAKGYVLYKVGKFGIWFHFTKGEPRKVIYQVDYQCATPIGYFSINQDAGWSLMFSRMVTNTLNIWRYAIGADGVAAKFYSDRESKLKKARRIILRFTIIYFLIVLEYIIIGLFNFNFVRGSGYHDIPHLIYTMAYIIPFGYLALRPILYYFRVRRNA